VLPTAGPIGWANFNYTIVAVVVVVGAAWLWWALSAKNWFTGPRHTVAGPVVTDADSAPDGAQVPGPRVGGEPAAAPAE